LRLNFPLTAKRYIKPFTMFIVYNFIYIFVFHQAFLICF